MASVETSDSNRDNPVEIDESFTGFATPGGESDEEFLVFSGIPGETVKITLLPDVYILFGYALYETLISSARIVQRVQKTADGFGVISDEWVSIGSLSAFPDQILNANYPGSLIEFYQGSVTLPAESTTVGNELIDGELVEVTTTRLEEYAVSFTAQALGFDDILNAAAEFIPPDLAEILADFPDLPTAGRYLVLAQDATGNISGQRAAAWGDWVQELTFDFGGTPVVVADDYSDPVPDTDDLSLQDFEALIPEIARFTDLGDGLYLSATYEIDGERYFVKGASAQELVDATLDVAGSTSDLAFALAQGFFGFLLGPLAVLRFGPAVGGAVSTTMQSQGIFSTLTEFTGNLGKLATDGIANFSADGRAGSFDHAEYKRQTDEITRSGLIKVINSVSGPQITDEVQEFTEDLSKLIGLLGFNSDKTFKITTESGFNETAGDHRLELYGSGFDDVVVGGEFADFLLGNAGNDTLSGGGNGDVLIGGLGNDVLSGDAGNDNISGGEGNDQADGGEGTDRYVHLILEEGTARAINNGATIDILDGPSGTTDTLSNFERLELSGELSTGGVTLDADLTWDGLVYLTGSAFNDELFGGQVPINVFQPGRGNDIIHGDAMGVTNPFATLDFLIVSYGAPAEVEIGANSIRNLSTGETDWFENIEQLLIVPFGELGDQNVINASKSTMGVEIENGLGDDVIVGSDFIDVIRFGDGMDTVTGGEGNDYFQFFVSIDGSETSSVITDFHAGDKIEIAGLSSMAAIPVLGAFTGRTGEVRAATIDGKLALEIDSDGDSAGDSFLIFDNIDGFGSEHIAYYNGAFELSDEDPDVFGDAFVLLRSGRDAQTHTLGYLQAERGQIEAIARDVEDTFNAFVNFDQAYTITVTNTDSDFGPAPNIQVFDGVGSELTTITDTSGATTQVLFIAGPGMHSIVVTDSFGKPLNYTIELNEGGIQYSLPDTFDGRALIDLGVDPDISGMTLDGSSVYVWTGVMSVRPGAEAIIDPGAILAARTIDSLIHIPVGARLLAEGEVDNPIEFTALGQLPGFAPSETTTWAGIHMDGDAPISGGTGISYPGGTFGGTNADHDGGVLKYVQINSAGSVVGNTSLALNGVGARTELAFIEINRAGDDGLIIHGGTAQLSNIAIINPGDDGLDFTGGWKGQLDFLLVDGRQSAQFDNGIEGDGRLGGDSGAPSEPLISHFTLLGGENSDTGILLKTAAGGRYQNGVISGFNVGVDLDAPNGSGPLAPLAFRSNLFIGPGSLFADDGDEPATTTQSFIQDAAALTVFIAAPDGTELSSEGLPGLGFPSVTVTGNTTNFAGDIVDRVGAFASTETPWNTWLSSWSSSVLPAEPTGTELADVIIATWQDTTTDISRGAPVTSINGAGGDDTLYGSGRNDDLNGGAGNDVVFGAAGDDRLVTGLGIDVIDGGDGVDTLIFEAAFNETSIGFGEDSISGSLGSASFQNIEAFVVDGTAVTSVGGLQLNASAAPAGVNVYGSDRADMFIGSSFEDQFRDSGGADTYTGGDGADTFVFDLSEAGRGNGDTITDFQDDDRLVFISLGISGFDAPIPTFIGSEAFFGVPGQFRVDRRGAQTVVQYDADGDGVSDNSIILDGNFILAADVEIIPLLGIDVDLFQVSMIVDRDNGETIGDDILTGTSAADVLFGGIGDDLIEGLSGPDTLDGGDGVDTLSFVSALNGITANLSSGIATDDGGDRDAISNFENLVGSMFDDVLRGGTGANRLVGGNGDDRLFAVGGNGNELIGGIGSDSLFGGDGADTLDGGTGDDLIQGLGGADTIRVESGSNVIFAGAGNDQVFGGIGDDTIDGESGNDVIFGDFGDDSIRGGVGADELRGEAGNDTLYGEDGDDRISGGTGNDTIFGGGGADDLTGGSEDDAIFGGDDNDLIQGQGGNDDLSGGSGDDLIRGGLNDDLLDGGDGDDLLIGGGGVDRFIAGAGDDSVVIDNDDIRQDESGRPLDIGGSGYDTLILAPGSTFATSVLERYGFEAFVGAENDDRVRGRDDNVSYRLEGRGGDDELQGAGGDDTLVGGAGADTLTGGDGFDFASYEDATARVIVRLSTGRGKEDVAQSDLLFSIEGLVGGNFNDALFGSDVDNTLIGGLGDDFLDGLDGDDLLVGGAGADRLVGGNGVDTVSFEYASEQVAIDLLTGDGQLGDAEGDIYQEIENIIGGLGHDSLFGDFGDNQISGRGGDDFLKGLDGADILIGDDGSDILIGGAGMDSFDAGEGNDTVYLDGDDLRFKAGSTTDRDFGGAGYDTLILEAGTQFITNGLGAFGFEAFRGAELNDRVRGNIASVDYDLDGGGGDDELTGNDGNDVLRGGLGVDIMLGLDGDDTIYFETGDVRMNSATGRALNMGGQGRDTLILEAGTRFVTNGLSLFGFEVFRGAELNDRVRGNFKSVEYDLDGGAGDDELTGNNQNDRLVGGVGNDILDGGAGDDTFVFDASHTGNDAVLRLQDRDTVLLTGFGYADAMDAAGDFTQVGADVVFSNGGVTITFQNKALSSVLATVELDLALSPSTDAAPAQMGAAVKEPVPAAVIGEIHAESFDFTGLNAPEEPAELALELALVANLDIEIGIIDAHHGFDIRFDGLELSTPWHGSDDLETIEGWG